MNNAITSISGGVVLHGLFIKNRFYENLEAFMNVTDLSLVFYITLVFIMQVLSLFAFIANTQLMGFHIYLAIKKQTTYEYILEKRKKSNPYRVSNIQIINSKEVIEELPLEEVYEPYTLNPQYKQDETMNEMHTTNCNKVVPCEEKQEQPQ
jgi:hypothetical protein